MNRADKPKQVEFKSRVVAAVEALEGYPGAPASLGQLAQDAGVSPPNLASALTLRRTMTWTALRRLHRALKLDSLGIDIEAWDAAAADPGALAAKIRERRAGDPVELARAQVRDPFVGVSTAGAFMGVRPVRAASAPRTPGIAAYPGQQLEITVNPPIDGFMKIICREGVDFFQLDSHLGLTHRRFRAGQPVLLDNALDVEAGYYGETVFIALASADPFDPGALRATDPSGTFSRETCADFLRAQFARDVEAWRASLFSVWTLPELVDPADPFE